MVETADHVLIKHCFLKYINNNNLVIQDYIRMTKNFLN